MNQLQRKKNLALAKESLQRNVQVERMLTAFARELAPYSASALARLGGEAA